MVQFEKDTGNNTGIVVETRQKEEVAERTL
jgi:hypothetical protein